MADLLAVILGAGEGTRMRSSVPKVMHKVGGLSMIGHVIRTSQAAGASRLAVVIGPDHDQLRREVAALAPDAAISVQSERLGTAHAVRTAQSSLEEAQGTVLVLFADNPLVTPATIKGIADRLDDEADIVVVGFEPDDPTGYGRLLTEGGELLAIREHKDASEAERSVSLCNSGVMGFRARVLETLIGRISNSNSKGEYYLTDAVELARADGYRVEFTIVPEEEVIGVDDRIKLARAEAVFQRKRRHEIMASGVTLHDPSTVYFAHDTQVEQDVVIEPSVVFGPGVSIGSGAIVHAFSHIEGASIGPNASVGPFARLRPDANLAEGAKVGNFVEIKKAEIGKGAKISHLSYVGDAEVGPDVNIGAGVITVNYDGFNKHKTVIGEGAFVGSNASLVAPVSIGAGALVGSGSVITQDVSPEALALGRARQVEKAGGAKAVFERAAALKASKTGKR